MFSNSITAMTVFDVSVIAMVLFMLIYFQRHARHMDNAQHRIGPTMILIGLSGFGVFYLLDLLTMHLLPQFVPMDRAMAAMNYLHLDVMWWAAGLSVSAIFFGFVKLVSNQSDLIRAENTARQNAESASASKSQFIATMSHEIRTPMNSVLGILNLLLEGDLSDRQRALTQTAEHSARDLSKVVEDILDASKIEMGAVKLEAIHFNPNQITESVIAFLKPIADAKGIWLTNERDEDLPTWLIGDPTRLRQVLLNLVGNAIKFTETGEVHVSTSCTRLGTELAEVQFKVRDTGIGIPSEVVPDIFNRFTQADSSITRKFGGTGLGLAISKELVDLMGGEIEVESQSGQGSTFRFAVRCQIAEAEVGAQDRKLRADLISLPTRDAEDHQAIFSPANAVAGG